MERNSCSITSQTTIIKYQTLTSLVLMLLPWLSKEQVVRMFMPITIASARITIGSSSHKTNLASNINSTLLTSTVASKCKVTLRSLPLLYRPQSSQLQSLRLRTTEHFWIWATVLKRQEDIVLITIIIIIYLVAVVASQA